VIIGVPVEVKPGERRVALMPRDAAVLASDGHEVRVQSGAGRGTGFRDDDYRAAGARIVDLAGVWQSELVVKVKELQEQELQQTRAGQTVFGFHHWIGHTDHARRGLAAGITAIAYEAVRDAQGGFPLLAPMSIIAGRMAIDVATQHLGYAPRKVLVLGAGHAGKAAAEAARGIGAEVRVLRRATATPEAIEEQALQSDLVVGAVFTAGEGTPKLMPRSLVARMKRGAMIIDISIEEGGVAETSRATSHEKPTFIEEGVIHYAVPNMPSALPREASDAISAAVLPYVRTLAGKGIANALRGDNGLRAGLLCWHGTPYTCASGSDFHD
jgi:alanine dehydrogenase